MYGNDIGNGNIPEQISQCIGGYSQGMEYLINV